MRASASEREVEAPCRRRRHRGVVALPLSLLEPPPQRRPTQVVRPAAPSQPVRRDCVRNHRYASRPVISGPLPSHEARIGAVRRYLGDPYFESESALLYCGDAIELMQALPPGFIALTTTSPPYNIGKEYEQLLDLDAYLSWCERWMGEIWRLTAEDGAFWLNLGYISIPGRGKAVPLPYLLWDKTPFHFIQEVVWNYGAGVAARQSFSPRNEKLLWYVKNAADYVFNLDDIRDPDVKYPNQKKNGKLKCNPLGKNPTDVWSIPKVTSGSGRASR
jgi:adenine-specific DNA-methyltransferase